MKVTVLDRQSLIDVALIATGSAEGAFDLALLNNLEITGRLQHGEILTCDCHESLDMRVIDAYRIEHVTPATDVSDEELAWLLGGRIFSDEFDMIFS